MPECEYDQSLDRPFDDEAASPFAESPAVGEEELPEGAFLQGADGRGVPPALCSLALDARPSGDRDKAPCSVAYPIEDGKIKNSASPLNTDGVNLDALETATGETPEAAPASNPGDLVASFWKERTHSSSSLDSDAGRCASGDAKEEAGPAPSPQAEDASSIAPQAEAAKAPEGAQPELSHGPVDAAASPSAPNTEAEEGPLQDKDVLAPDRQSHASGLSALDARGEGASVPSGVFKSAACASDSSTSAAFAPDSSAPAAFASDSSASAAYASDGSTSVAAASAFAGHGYPEGLRPELEAAGIPNGRFSENATPLHGRSSEIGAPLGGQTRASAGPLHGQSSETGAPLDGRFSATAATLDGSSCGATSLSARDTATGTFNPAEASASADGASSAEEAEGIRAAEGASFFDREEGETPDAGGKQEAGNTLKRRQCRKKDSASRLNSASRTVGRRSSLKGLVLAVLVLLLCGAGVAWGIFGGSTQRSGKDGVPADPSAGTASPEPLPSGASGASAETHPRLFPVELSSERTPSSPLLQGRALALSAAEASFSKPAPEHLVVDSSGLSSGAGAAKDSANNAKGAREAVSPSAGHGAMAGLAADAGKHSARGVAGGPSHGAVGGSPANGRDYLDRALLEEKLSEEEAKLKESEARVAALERTVGDLSGEIKSLCAEKDAQTKLLQESAALLKKERLKRDEQASLERRQASSLEGWRVLGLSSRRAIVRDASGRIHNLGRGDSVDGIRVIAVDINSGNVETTKGTLRYAD